MKRFLQAAFKITLFEVIFIAALAGLKYILTTCKITDRIEKPFAWFCFGAGVIFVLVISLMGFIENRGSSFEEWKTKPQKSTKEKFMVGLVNWGTTIPTLLAFILFVYIITPTSFFTAIAFYIGVVIRNYLTFFSEKKATNS